MNGYQYPRLLEWKEYDGKVTSPEGMLSGRETTVVEVPAGGRSPEFLLDFGRKTTGYLHIELEGSSRDSLRLDFGPLRRSLHVRRDIRMPEAGVAYVDGEYLACRYLRLSFRGLSRQPAPISVRIRRLGLVFSGYPAVYRGEFRCDRPELERIWETGAYTVQLCMQKHTASSAYQFDLLPEPNRDFIRNWRSRYSPYVIFDGPRRDRETWLGDIRTEALVIYGAFGADEVVKSSLEVFLDLQRPDGTTVGCGATWQEFREYNLWWVIAIWECFLFTGDRDFLRYFYPGIRALVGWIRNRQDERGFLFNDGNWMWTLPREGYSSATQCILVRTLEDVAKIEREMDNEPEAARLEADAARIREGINRVFWDGERGIYIDHLRLLNADTPVMSDVNVYAVLFGIADDRQRTRLLSYLRAHMWTPYGSATLDRRIETAYLAPDVRHYGLAGFVRGHPEPEKAIVEFMYPHNRQVWPFINGYEVEARFAAGDEEGAFELMDRCWGNMLRGEPGTFWECVDADTGEFPLRSFFPGSKMDCINSAAHGWSGWISWILQACVLGIRPVSPGFRRIRVSPRLGPLQQVSGRVPTPLGAISAAWVRTEEVLSLDMTLPEGIDIDLQVPDSTLCARRLETHIVRLAADPSARA